MKVTVSASIVKLLALVPLAVASPLVQPRQSITTLTASQIAAYKPYTNFAAAGYCSPSSTLAWNCGAKCSANSGFAPVASGGDGSSTQFWYVGYSAAQGTVIVGHQGTDASQIQPLLTDAEAVLSNLDSSLFPGVSSNIMVHDGFKNAQAKAATQVLAAVQTAISTHHATRVTIIGHSLGAAIALLDSVYLPLHIPGVTFRTIGYGMPRVGNQAFADYVDSHLSLTHINNKEDFVPILPGRFLGYHHPAGEVHIQDTGAWASCPGQDNTSTQCTVGDVPNIFDGSTNDHDGPYNGVEMGC